MKPIDRGTISLAGEFAVASELCRRSAYAQLTLGNLKRTDLLVMTDEGQVAKIEVKAKQAGEWPACRGISGDNRFIVFVDYANRSSDATPDFYVLSSADWRACVEARIAELRTSNPVIDVAIGSDNVPVFHSQRTKLGKPVRGITVRPALILKHRNEWRKILEYVGVGAE